MGIMLTFTDKAVQQVNSIRKSKELGDTHLLRIFVEPGGCSGLEYGMGFSEAKDGDQRLESNGIAYLMDAQSMELLKGSVVDFDDGLSGKGFEIKNPNASNTCGCGKSFN